ncbi:MAG: tRNA 2-selenouridine(34) synthase MnmH [Verrucomicrobiota bacterium]
MFRRFHEQRKEVGTIYKQVSAFQASKLGASMVSENIADHIRNYLIDKPKDYRPLLCCWRGGLRSSSMATVLRSVGWQAGVVTGGYRAYRHFVVNFLKEFTPARVIVINGYTGSGKTLLLKTLATMGQQVLDLEGLANHKGSVFGGDPNHPQPAQKRFESLIYDQLVQFDPSVPIFIEAESAKVGRLNLPNPLWQQMKGASVFEVSCSLANRANYLVDDYHEWLDDEDRILTTIERLRGFHAHALLDQWCNDAREKQWQALVESLLSEHYDKRYKSGGSSYFQEPSSQFCLQNHSESAITECAESLIRAAKL